MKRNRLGNEEEESLLNLTPLIDVVFVVLILFILVAPMVEVDKVQLASHTTDSPLPTASPQASPITLYVRADNSIWMNNTPLSLTELLLRLKQARAQHPGKIPQVFHDKKAQFGTYQAVKDTLESAGFTEMEIILQPGK